MHTYTYMYVHIYTQICIHTYAHMSHISCLLYHPGSNIMFKTIVSCHIAYPVTSAANPPTHRIVVTLALRFDFAPPNRTTNEQENVTSREFTPSPPIKRG